MQPPAVDGRKTAGRTSGGASRALSAVNSKLMLKARTYTGIGNLPERYGEQFAEASQDSFFLSLPWFRTLESIVLGHNELAQIIGVESDEPSDAALGALVLKISEDGRRFFSPRTVDSLTNYYSSYFAPILTRNSWSPDQVVRMIVGELKSRSPQWDILNIRPLDLSLAGVQSLHLAMEASGLKTQTYFCFGNWYLNVNGRSYAEYFKDLPSVIRKNVPYYKRRLEKTARVRVQIYTGLKDLEAAIDDYETIYNSSWRDREGYPGFIRAFIRTAAEEGWLRLGVFYIDDEPAAAQLWIVHGRVASIYKICYAEKFAKSSVGSVLTTHMLEHALDRDKVSEVDYLTGDDSYKSNWMSDRRERWGIMAFNPTTVLGKLSTLKHIGGKILKAKLGAFAHNVTAPFRGLHAGD
jgi:hypothetical protein